MILHLIFYFHLPLSLFRCFRSLSARCPLHVQVVVLRTYLFHPSFCHSTSTRTSNVGLDTDICSPASTVSGYLTLPKELWQESCGVGSMTETSTVRASTGTLLALPERLSLVVRQILLVLQLGDFIGLIVSIIFLMSRWCIDVWCLVMVGLGTHRLRSIVILQHLSLVRAPSFSSSPPMSFS